LSGLGPWLRLSVIALVLMNALLLGWRLASEPGQPADIPAGPAEPSAPDLTDVPRIELLSERLSNDTVMPDSQRSGSGGSPRWCFAVGPFETIASRERARAALDGVTRVGERESEALIELGYWVSLPPFPNFAAAGAAVRELDRAGLRDTSILAGEDGEYRVSLGYFLDEANARRRRDHARSLGYDAETRLQRETQPRYWLHYERDSTPPGDPPAGIPAAQHRSIPCPQPGPTA
jgi:hypothetical protein